MGFTKKTPDSAFSNFLDDTKKAVYWVELLRLLSMSVKRV